MAFKTQPKAGGDDHECDLRFNLENISMLPWILFIMLAGSELTTVNTNARFVTFAACEAAAEATAQEYRRISKYYKDRVSARCYHDGSPNEAR
jgi:hypothetical protein